MAPVDKTPDLIPLIDTLILDYRALERTKFAEGKIREERTMRPKGRLGPSYPGKDKPMDLCLELEERLFEFVTDAKRFITPGRGIGKNWGELLPWLRFNAALIEELDPHWVRDFADELRYQHAKIQHLITPRVLLRERAEPWQPAPAIIASCRAHGVSVTTEYLRQLAHRGHIQHLKRGNSNLYRASQVIRYFKENSRELR